MLATLIAVDPVLAEKAAKTAAGDTIFCVIVAIVLGLLFLRYVERLCRLHSQIPVPASPQATPEAEESMLVAPLRAASTSAPPQMANPPTPTPLMPRESAVSVELDRFEEATGLRSYPYPAVLYSDDGSRKIIGRIIGRVERDSQGERVFVFGKHRSGTKTRFRAALEALRDREVAPKAQG